MAIRPSVLGCPGLLALLLPPPWIGLGATQPRGAAPPPCVAPQRYDHNKIYNYYAPPPLPETLQSFRSVYLEFRCDLEVRGAAGESPQLGSEPPVEPWSQLFTEPIVHHSSSQVWGVSKEGPWVGGMRPHPRSMGWGRVAPRTAAPRASRYGGYPSAAKRKWSTES